MKFKNIESLNFLEMIIFFMELQILDCDYTLVNSKPIIRLFCKDAQGETVCVFYDKFFPYFYLHGDESKYQEIIKEIKNKYPNLKVEIVEKSLPIGYQPPVKVLKITGNDPSITPEIREFAKRFGTPYEADVLFRYRFMADFDLKGMGWINAEGKFTKTNTVKCKALVADSIKPIEMLKNAPLKIMSLDIECLPEEIRLPIPEKDKIIVISLAFSPTYKEKDHLVIVAKSVKTIDNTIACKDEKEMLERFKEILDDYDADVICGHNINGFDLPFLIKRLEVLNMSRDLGRSEKSSMSRKLQHSYMPNICGRVVVDSFEIFKRDPWVKFKRYDLSTISKQLLGEEKIDLGSDHIKTVREMWNGEGIYKFIDYAKKDAELALRLVVERRLLDKFLEVAKACGLLLQDCLGGQSQRHEFRLLKEFNKRNFIVPCKPGDFSDADREQHGLKGALVLEPETGLHEWVICLDFTSMYPSLIKAFNICTTTYLTNGENIDHFVSPYGTKFVKSNVLKGIIPIVVEDLLNTRANVRKQLKLEKDPENKRILQAKQLALKDLSNSLYGYTGYAKSRLYVMDIANTITAFGRDTITKTKKLIEENFPVKVIYADTDSVFIKSDVKSLEEAEDFGRRISAFVSERLYGLDLKFEKVYKTFLIETKKRYAGWTFEREGDKWSDRMEMKGIETVRRDWCSLASETMLNVLNIILKEKDINKASKYVRGMVDDLAKGKIPLEKLAIVKGITKAIDSYDGVQPHIELAKKLAQRDKSRSLVGERLEYVIIKGNQLLSKRAEDPKFVKEKGLEIDPEYYIYNQLLPPLERIFEVCGISSSELLEGVKQKSLLDMLNGQKKQLSPEEIVLKNFEMVTCKNCGWEFRRPTLNGNCPKCSGQLYFVSSGSIGKTVDLTKN
jgi:DNA polymerase I